MDEASRIRNRLEAARFAVADSTLPDERKEELEKLLRPAVDKLNEWIAADAESGTPSSE